MLRQFHTSPGLLAHGALAGIGYAHQLLISSETVGDVSFQQSTNGFLTGKVKATAYRVRSDNWVIRRRASDAERFTTLAKEWRQERGATSSITKMVTTPAYQKIVAMGPAALPFLISQLRQEGDDPDMWFWALELITGENPIPMEDMGDMRAMARAWIRWGEQNGYGWQLVSARLPGDRL